tara:strand:+ start:261 stop:530 length:270 start_codon:yes stop_codon:yes gene_type:complete
MKFGYFHKGKSHQFEADASVTDYLIESDKAKKLMRGRKIEEALSIYTALADDKSTTSLQGNFALGQAGRCARLLKNDDLAKELEGRISK